MILGPDPYRLVALVAGIAFFVVGIVMVFLGISAEGSIDVQGAIVSGKIRTGSAGLFVLFFSFLMIVVSVGMPWAGRAKDRELPMARGRMFRRALAIFLLLLGLTISSGLSVFFIGKEAGAGFVLAALFFGVMTFLSLFFLLDAIEREK